MEFFLPSLIILALASIVSFVIIPKTSPLIILIISFCLLIFGMYHHYTLFASEYRLSTWQDQLKFYGPGIAIGGLLLFIILFVLSIFRGGQVPVPEISLTPASSTGTVGSILNTVTNAASNMINTATNTVDNIKNTVKTAVTQSENIVNRSKNTIRTSFFSKV